MEFVESGFKTGVGALESVKKDADSLSEFGRDHLTKAVSSAPVLDDFDPISTTRDFLADMTKSQIEEDIFSKPLPPEPSNLLHEFTTAEVEKIKEQEINFINEMESDIPNIPPPVISDEEDEFRPTQTPEPEFESVREIIKEKEPEPVVPSIYETVLPEPIKPVVQSVIVPPVKDELPQPKIEKAQDIGPKDVFAKLGFNTWFDPGRLHPKVESLVYWRDPIKSGAALGSILLILFALSNASIISVLAYGGLLVIALTVLIKVYSYIALALHKEPPPVTAWLQCLEQCAILPSEERIVEGARDLSRRLAPRAEEMRRYLLVKDPIDTTKMALCLWGLTFIGSWFNGMTLLIIAVLASFILPKVYENNKKQIDQYIELASGKITEITDKVKAAIPMGKKTVEAEKPKDQ